MGDIMAILKILLFSPTPQTRLRPNHNVLICIYVNYIFINLNVPGFGLDAEQEQIHPEKV